MGQFTTLLRVRYHEMDSLGHVNNAVYQHYLEQAAVEHSESLGFNQQRYAALGGVFVMRRVQLEYLRSAVAGDWLEVTTWLHQIKGTRATRHYEIRKQGDENLILTAEALWVWVDGKTMRPKAIPEDVFQAFEAVQRANLEDS